MKTMKKTRILERVIGILFILATLTYGIGNSMITEGIKNNSQANISFFGMGLELVNSLVVTAIGILTYYVLKSFDKSVIKGYAISRILEGILLAAGAISVIWLNESNLTSILKFREVCFSFAMLLLGAYSIRFFWYLLQKRLAPRWMMLLGILGYLTLCVYAVSFVTYGTASMLLFIPGGVFEVIFPIYLIAKGYKILEK